MAILICHIDCRNSQIVSWSHLKAKNNNINANTISSSLCILVNMNNIIKIYDTFLLTLIVCYFFYIVWQEAFTLQPNTASSPQQQNCYYRVGPQMWRIY